MTASPRLHALPTEFASIVLRQTRSNLCRHLHSWFLSHPQSRCLHLYVTANAKSTLGNHKLLPFTRYKLPPPENSNQKIIVRLPVPPPENIDAKKEAPVEDNEAVQVDNNEGVPKGQTNAIREGIWEDQAGWWEETEMSLKEVLDLVRPGQLLYPLDPLPKWATREDGIRKRGLEKQCKRYGIIEAGKRNLPIARKKVASISYVHLGMLKEIHFSLNCSSNFAKLQLDRTFQFIQAGHPVEFCIRRSGAKKDRETKSQLEPVVGAHSTWHWIHNHFPHMRPDVILKGMPQGTYFKISPWSDGNHVQWVMAPTTQQEIKSGMYINFDKRLDKVKARVKEDIRTGKQAQLPMLYRKKLIESGSQDYSLDTGEPKGLVGDERVHLNNHKAEFVEWGGGWSKDERWLSPAKKKRNQLKEKEKLRERRVGLGRRGL
ncbi:hypothetical protein BCR34DRAFT_576274 [Clohesyomyces aquaticus]|uniref:Uncharacterized protein n=1 Tax=Clohesyomyces aquaticus TaxID=1231657 RepID=A0A1Y1YP93_9PLEO|nr:hypothetical protein BCR34DRAFT_576274 [Clohesyomyces aquaticus]